MSRARVDKSRSTAGHLLFWAATALLVGLALPRTARAAAEQGQAAPAPLGETVAALKEIPVWELASERVRQAFLRGQFAPTYAWHKGQVGGVKCPEFASDAPFCGEVDFPGLTPGSPESARRDFALDCSRKGGDYDLLYFDDNGDGDLTNDKPRKPAPQSDRLSRRVPPLKETFFEPVTVTFGVGPGGPQTLELLPCLRIYEGSAPQLSFIAARVHTGTFELGGTSYQAVIGYQYAINGRLDGPSTALLLHPQGGEPTPWSGADQLSATRLLDGRFYRFSCTPAGDKLTAQPYLGPLGVFEIGPGGRNAGAMTMMGSLRSATTSVPVGTRTFGNRPPEPTRSWKLPLGDYRINDLWVHVGGLQALTLSNYHADGKPMGAMEQQNTYDITIREDKPFVLTFSASGQVLFAEPARDRRVWRGEELSVKAVLIDPAFHVMFRVLTHGEQLDPKVVIRRANGEIVAEGTMPFG